MKKLGLIPSLERRMRVDLRETFIIVIWASPFFIIVLHPSKKKKDQKKKKKKKKLSIENIRY